MTGEKDMTPYCEHPEVEVRPTNSMWGGAECYCSVCGHQWYATQKEIDADRAARARESPPKETEVLVTPSGHTFINPEDWY